MVAAERFVGIAALKIGLISKFSIHQKKIATRCTCIFFKTLDGM
jgi:hypothetical protein